MALKKAEQNKIITLHEKQAEVFDFETQFCAAIAGVRGGKTYVGATWAGNKIYTEPGNGLITAPDYKTLHDATLTTFFQLFPQYRRFYKQQRSLIELPGGKYVYLRSLDDPLAAEGLTTAWGWGDEAGKYKLLAWHSLRSRVSLTRGQILLTTTPYDMGWLHGQFYVPWQNRTDPDLTVVTWRSIDNPYFPKEVYEAERKRLTPAEFGRRYEGIFTRMQGLVYTLSPWHFLNEPPPGAEIILGGIDWGWTNPAALVIIKVVDGAFYVVDEWYQTNKTTTEIIEAAIALQKKWKVNRWYADSANPEKIAESNNATGLYVLPYTKGKDSISQGVSLVQQLINENRFFVVRGLTNWTAESESYSYPAPDDNGFLRKDEPLPFNNHLMDATRYAVHGFAPAQRGLVRGRRNMNESYTDASVRRMLGGSRRSPHGEANDDV